VPWIVRKGVDWFKSMGTERSPGPKMVSISGHVEKPGQYEVGLGTTFRELLQMAGGMRNGARLKAWTPGGSSTPMLTAEHLDTPMDFEGVQSAGSLLGTAAVMVMDESVCMVKTCLRLTEFYAHESCGKCTPCREGTYWMTQILHRLESGVGSEEDLDTLLDTCDNIFGRSFCALGDGATSPIVSGIKYFRDEFVEHYTLGRCPFKADSDPIGQLALAGAHA
jgi:NADH-quinone oxidoreductase subunit F